MNKALKVLYGCQNRTPIESLYKSTNNLQLNEIMFIHNVIYICRYIHGTLKHNKNYIVDGESINNIYMEVVRIKREISENKAVKDYNFLPE